MSVCRYCEKRHIGCHSTCKEYIAECESRAVKNKEQRDLSYSWGYSWETRERLRKKGKIGYGNNV